MKLFSGEKFSVITSQNNHKYKNHSCFVRIMKILHTTVWVLALLVHRPCSLLRPSYQFPGPKLFFSVGIQLLMSACLEIIGTFLVKYIMFYYFCFCSPCDSVEQKKMFSINLPWSNCTYMLLRGFMCYSPNKHYKIYFSHHEEEHSVFSSAY